MATESHGSLLRLSQFGTLECQEETLGAKKRSIPCTVSSVCARLLEHDTVRLQVFTIGWQFETLWFQQWHQLTRKVLSNAIAVIYYFRQHVSSQELNLGTVTQDAFWTTEPNAYPSFPLLDHGFWLLRQPFLTHCPSPPTSPLKIPELSA